MDNKENKMKGSLQRNNNIAKNDSSQFSPFFILIVMVLVSAAVLLSAIDKKLNKEILL